MEPFGKLSLDQPVESVEGLPEDAEAFPIWISHVPADGLTGKRPGQEMVQQITGEADDELDLVEGNCRKTFGIEPVGRNVVFFEHFKSVGGYVSERVGPGRLDVDYVSPIVDAESFGHDASAGIANADE
jgi:hypothetical protein